MKRTTAALTILMVAGLIALLPGTAGATTRTTWSSSRQRGIPIEISLDNSVGQNLIQVPDGLTFGGTPFIPGPINLGLKGKAKGLANIDLFRGTLSISFTSIEIQSDPVVIMPGCPQVGTAPLTISQDPAHPSTGSSNLRTGKVTTSINVIARTYLVNDSSACGGTVLTTNYTETTLATQGTGSMQIQLGISSTGSIIIGKMKTVSTSTDVVLGACQAIGPATTPCPADQIANLDPAKVTTLLSGKVGLSR